ncbi:MAG TPA: pyridoxal-phosphate dependent enzyme [Leptospiraceae bacterium]|nr:pyridoxal-phosphate dependent enzyme [Leptospiraceae bacterium]HMW04174.1 pyridoxal-phosphate dependent enzyme [Leptospiraceae bacterium]HMX34677.1 pyridoxal-phosphate dependent enzyme [Leptospiraceae bacterium]HMY30167.1 pyridoxal-phosphate dependent enzyme [Leptospiraceae bacterium]HMZ65150.1 pyridoxal-phosphate dependent enzyme [Leptospiraceae bacterium]
MNLNFYRPTPVEIFDTINGFDLFIKREDKTFGGFGVKWKKVEGLIQFLKNGHVKEVLIYGNPHSNYVSTFSFFLKKSGFFVYSIFYTNDSKLVTPNSILSHRFSDSVISIKAKANRDFYIQNFKSGFPNGFVIPEFGIHESGIKSLNTLWRDAHFEKMNYLFLDIGTGYTLLSALEYFKEKPIQIIGVAIGNRFDKIQYDLEKNAEKLSVDKNLLKNIQILEPKISPSFASKNKEIENWIREIWEKKQIPLEPIYSGKTLYTVLDFIQKKRFQGNGIYVHQGGLLNHLKYFMP